MLFGVGVCIAQRSAGLLSLRRRQSLRVGQRPPQKNDPWSRLMCRLVGIPQRQGKSRPGMSVVISTAYMDEAQQWDWIVAMDAGRVLATGSPKELMERTGTKDLEQCFIALLP